ncbi:hypothetical protein HHI36_014730 [Cryptolaemus montrouzieri]|uniref:ZAD domain-containing protein n=1 Tax=Cryptolaemus montrouzieri TaxID=559131 RepID=A0ABD2N3F9_9CUCU
MCNILNLRKPLIEKMWLENLCRLCGAINSNSHSVFKLAGNETIEYKIKKCLNFSIFKEDYKPKEICDHCLVKIEIFSEFVDVCLSTNQRFDSLIMNRNSWCDIKENSDSDYNQPKTVIVNLKNGIENHQNESLDVLQLENMNVPLNDDVLQVGQNSMNIIELCLRTWEII